jgi:hypothetical protein
MSRSTTRFVWFLLGLTGTGKTFLAEQYLGAYQRPIIIPDTMGEWQDYGRVYEDPERLLIDATEALNGAGFPPGGIFVLRPFDTSTVHRLFELAHQWRVPGTFVCDEVHQYAPSGKETAFLEMIRMGRHASQSVVGITQRPQGIHNHAVEEAALTSFALSGRAAQYVTDDRHGYMPRDLTPEKLRKLPEQHYVLGGRFEQLPFGESLGDPDGSVWRYYAPEHETRQVDPAE